MKFDLLIINPAIQGGKVCVKDTRISVEVILEWLASGAGIKDIIEAHPQLSEKAVVQAINYASNSIKNEIIIDLKMAS